MWNACLLKQTIHTFDYRFINKLKVKTYPHYQLLYNLIVKSNDRNKNRNLDISVFHFKADIGLFIRNVLGLERWWMTVYSINMAVNNLFSNDIRSTNNHANQRLKCLYLRRTCFIKRKVADKTCCLYYGHCSIVYHMRSDTFFFMMRVKIFDNKHRREYCKQYPSRNSFYMLIIIHNNRYIFLLERTLLSFISLAKGHMIGCKCTI